MCLLVVASRVVAGEPLIVGANRDEVVERPSTAVTVLDEGPPRIVGGRDELSGGTWLAVNELGRVCRADQRAAGRGQGPVQAVPGRIASRARPHAAAAEAVDALLAGWRPADYNGSWLLVGDRHSLFFVDFTGSGDGFAVELPPGIHVLENRALGETSPKVDLVREALDDLAPAPDGDEVAHAFRRVLADHRNPEGEERPNAANCVHLETFGTRSSCMVRVPSAPAVAPRVWVADGPPCTTPYEDVSGLWTVPVPAA